MPLLDVSSVLFDADFADRFTVRRRTETLDIHGRSTVQNQDTPNVIGVVTANSPSDLDRREDYQNMTRSIGIVTQFRLRGETTSTQPDIVIWRGSNYLVKHVDPYPQFGKGFMQAECSSMDRVDPPFDPAVSGQVSFNQSQNAIFAILG